MNREPQNGLQCSQFEALLADALDWTGLQPDGSDIAGEAVLSAQTRQAFEAHRASCSVCGPMFAEAQQGMSLLRSMPEVEPPRNLVHNILAATSLSGGEAKAGVAAKTGWLERLRLGLRPSLGGMLHSRFVTSFCMAFFSLSLTLSLAGVKFTDLSKAVAHPSTFRKSVVLQYTQVEARFMRYYDNMRVVSEIRTRVDQLKKATAPRNSNTNNNDNKQEQNRKQPVDPGRPEQQENYSQQRDNTLIAKSAVKDEGAQI